MQQPEAAKSQESSGSQQEPASPQNPLSSKTSATPSRSESDQPLWDPLRAEKSIEVGQYYLKKGNYDAAIGRFRAALYHPGRALPYKLLGQAQEKKGLKAEGVQSFQKYLDLYSQAEDADKVRKHIAKLWQELDRSKKKSRSS